MTPTEKARSIIMDLSGCGLDACESAPCICQDTIATALAKARRGALKEAARVALAYAQERTQGWPGLDQDEICHAVCGDINASIRALAKDTTDGE